LYDYGYSGDSDDYCGGYGYLDCGNNVRSHPCGGNYYGHDCGAYLYADCGATTEGSSYFDVYSPCNGYGYGYPCGGLEYDSDCNGYFGDYGYSSSTPCGNSFYLYDYGYSGDSDDYCGGYGYLDCGNNVRSHPCGGNYYGHDCGAYLYADCGNDYDGSCYFDAYGYGNGYGYGDDCGALSYSNNCYGSVVSYCDDDDEDDHSGFYFDYYSYCDDDSDNDGYYGDLYHTGHGEYEPCGDYGYGFNNDLYVDYECDYESRKVCPGIDIDEDNYQECPEGLLWNGEECVGLDECMCISDDYNHPSGSVWKEDGGCTNCICIDGQAKCTKEVCDDVTCSPGYVQIVPVGSCCPVCTPTNVTCDTHLVGETWEENCEVCTCAADGSSQCVAVECPVCDLVCEDDEELVSIDNGCCPRFECKSKGSVTYVYVCATVKNCPAGYTVSDVVDEHGCINRTCTPPDHCIYNGDVHMPGVTWDEDVCLECTCSATPNADGEYTSECTSIQCGKCSSGYTYVPVPGECCGDCVPITCHYDGIEHSVGQTWAPEADNCTTCSCTMNPVTGEVYTTCQQASCPLMTDNCPADKIVTSEDGCCTYCEATKECQPQKTTYDTVELDGCVAQAPLDIMTCEGSCTSQSVFSFESGNFTKQCSCCSTMETEDRTVDLVCPDGSTKTITYQTATSCGCASKKCEDLP